MRRGVFTHAVHCTISLGMVYRFVQHAAWVCATCCVTLCDVLRKPVQYTERKKAAPEGISRSLVADALRLFIFSYLPDRKENFFRPGSL